MKKTALLQLKEKIIEIIHEYFIMTKQNCVIPFICWVVFFSIAVISSVIANSFFYFFNFLYIGTALSLGLLMSHSLRKKYIQWSRRITQILIGCYMLFFIGLVGYHNLQIEGLFYYLILGIISSAAVMHYLIAKVLGPIIFNRGWCGWACWTAMILDILSLKEQSRKIPKI